MKLNTRSRYWHALNFESKRRSGSNWIKYWWINTEYWIFRKKKKNKNPFNWSLSLTWKKSEIKKRNLFVCKWWTRFPKNGMKLLNKHQSGRSMVNIMQSFIWKFFQFENFSFAFVFLTPIYRTELWKFSFTWFFCPKLVECAMYTGGFIH